MARITRNAVRCIPCDEVIESKHTHDWVQCSGRHVYIDGGLSYLRMGAQEGARWEDLSEHADD